MMRSQLAALRLRNPPSALTTVPPASTSTVYSARLADLAARILYRSPLPSIDDLPVFILNAAALPDARDTDYDALLPYVLARLPDEEELIGGLGYELVFFAGGSNDGAASTKKGRPGVGWFFQAYHILSRAMRKRLKKMYIVHEKNWIRILIEMFSTVVSPKFRKKVVHVSTISGLALHITIEDLLIPPSAYLVDRRFSKDIHVPYTTGRRAFAVQRPLPTSSAGLSRLPRVLREATSFVVIEPVIKTEGIFRISPRVMIVDILAESYDRGQKFIVWREGNSYLCHSHKREGIGEVWVDEMDQTEGYDVHTAAGIIKKWYKELREPIFPEMCYAALERFYGNPQNKAEGPLKAQQLINILSDNDNWSPISKTAKKILTTHLLPLLSRVSDFQEWNQMTAYNLAVCFSPCLLRGPDPLEDVKIAKIICRILTAMIQHWKVDLAPLFDMCLMKFEDSLRLPEAVEDREDPVQETAERHASIQDQTSGITLVDNEYSDEEVETKPPLPPRPTVSPADTAFTSSMATVRRKPAPLTHGLPTYSVGATVGQVNLANAPFYNTVASEGDPKNFQDESELPLYVLAHPSVTEKTIPIIPTPIADTSATPETGTAAQVTTGLATTTAVPPTRIFGTAVASVTGDIPLKADAATLAHYDVQNSVEPLHSTCASAVAAVEGAAPANTTNVSPATAEAALPTEALPTAAPTSYSSATTTAPLTPPSMISPISAVLRKPVPLPK